MILHWPQVTELFLLALSLGINSARHGQPRTGKYSTGETLLSIIFVSVILYYGGFWTGGTP